MTEAIRAIVFAAGGLTLALTYATIRTSRIPASSPHRLVAELRLAQLAALVLVLTAGVYVGFVAAAAGRGTVGIDVALAVGFFVVAAVTLTRDPREALTILALSFGAHALVDVLHRPGMLAPDLAPTWYAIGCATLNLYFGVCCYLPLMRRAS